MKSETRIKIAKLDDMTVDQLIAFYEDLFDEGCRSRHRKYLVRRIAWRLQSRDEGGRSVEAEKKASELAAASDVRVTAPRVDVVDRVRRKSPEVDGYVDWDPRLPPPGNYVERLYKGKMIRVLVLTDGFEYEGRRYRSLSNIAGEVSGSSYNGFVFFKLGKRQS
jgi:hypothetical protein